MRTLRPAALEALSVLAVFGADRATKVWALRALPSDSSLHVLPLLHFTYVENTGAAWGMLRGGNTLLIAVSLVLLAALLQMRRRWAVEQVGVRYGAALVVGGALGNLYDRLTLRFVVDFLEFTGFPFPVFNVADSAITVGACLLAWGLKDEKDESAPANPSPK
ncbi:MAG: signal peptidase II [Elusimicrobiota bacterium]